MSLTGTRYLARPPVQFGGLKKVLRKVAGPVLAAGAIASGNPQLAVAGYSLGKSAAGKKKAKLQPPVEAVPPPGFLDQLTPADRTAVYLAGGLVGSLVLVKLLRGGKR